MNTAGGAVVPGDANPSGDAETARRLRQALDAMAAGVRPRPDAYERALAEWRRRERRRRLVGVLLACLVFAAADGIGVWALNHGARQQHRPNPVVFDAPAPAAPHPASPRHGPPPTPPPSSSGVIVK